MLFLAPSVYDAQKRGRCEQEVSLRQHRFCDSRHLVQTGQPVRICLEAQYFRLHASAVPHQVFAEIRHSLNAHIANVEDQLQLLFLNPHFSAINSTVVAFCSVVCLEVRYQVSYQQG
ncbi:conserved hypothetical protein [Trichinella spiralis]|uniref:hypothetical protein n=1 Tax=Trichinella spiralis TaxID=6334 RepID=UPI0001EFD97F|nr:conserved hypothetical protein [Trichinella spiralis]